MKRTSKNSRTLIDVVKDQQKALQTLARYVRQIENELKMRDLAFEKFNDESIRHINATIRAKAQKNDKGEWIIPKIPRRDPHELIKDLDIEVELRSRTYFHIKRPSELL